jgi:hypothetical protein
VHTKIDAMMDASRSPSSILEGRSRVPLACQKSQVLDFNLDSDFISLKLQLLREKINLCTFVVGLLFPLRNLRADGVKPAHDGSRITTVGIIRRAAL